MTQQRRAHARATSVSAMKLAPLFFVSLRHMPEGTRTRASAHRNAVLRQLMDGCAISAALVASPRNILGSYTRRTLPLACSSRGLH